MRMIFVSLGFAFCLTTSALAQSVVNPLYELKQKELCKPPEGQALNSVEHRARLADAAKLWLLKKFPVTAEHRCEFELSQRELLKLRIAPIESSTPEQCKGKKDWSIKAQNLAPQIRFKDQDNALRFRNSLLRIFEASFSGGTNGFLVVRNSTNLTNPDAKLKSYRPLQDPIQDDLAVRRFLDGQDDFQIICANPSQSGTLMIAGVKVQGNEGAIETRNQDDTTARPTQSESSSDVLITAKSQSSSWVQPVRGVLSSLAQNHNWAVDEAKGHSWTGQLKIVKDKSQFTATKPEGISIGTEFDRDASSNQSDLSVNAAIGYRFNFVDFNQKKPTEFGTSLSLVPFLSIDQKQADVAVQDTDNPFFLNGEPNVTKGKFASATIFGGIRGEFENVKPACANQNCGGYWNNGLRLPGQKFTGTIGLFTDNYSDQQGFQVEAGYSPGFLSVIPGYRQASRIDLGSGMVNSDPGEPLGLLNSFTSGYFEWNASIIGDRVEYARAPRDRESLPPEDRLESPDASRLGIDADFKVRWNNVFSLPGDDAGLQFSAKYKFREGLESGQRTVQDFNSELLLTDLLNKRYKFGLTYRVGRDLLTLDKFDLVGVKVETAF